LIKSKLSKNISINSQNVNILNNFKITPFDMIYKYYFKYFFQKKYLNFNNNIINQKIDLTYFYKELITGLFELVLLNFKTFLNQENQSSLPIKFNNFNVTKIIKYSTFEKLKLNSLIKNFQIFNLFYKDLFLLLLNDLEFKLEFTHVASNFFNGNGLDLPLNKYINLPNRRFYNINYTFYEYFRNTKLSNLLIQYSNKFLSDNKKTIYKNKNIIRNMNKQIGLDVYQQYTSTLFINTQLGFRSKDRNIVRAIKYPIFGQFTNKRVFNLFYQYYNINLIRRIKQAEFTRVRKKTSYLSSYDRRLLPIEFKIQKQIYFMYYLNYQYKKLNLKRDTYIPYLGDIVLRTKGSETLE
jgi:hypothetical protein